MLWLLLILAGAGVGIYLLDKKIKRKFEDKFNPRDWDLPVDNAAVPASVVIAGNKSQPVATAQEPPFSYELRDKLFSEPERSLFDLLQAALNPDFRVLIKVSLADVISTRGQHGADFKQVDQRLARSFFNFVVCDKHQLKPLCGLVLKGEVGGIVVADIAQRAGVPVLTLEPDRAYRMQELRDLVLSQVTGEIIKTAEPVAAQPEAVKIEVAVLQPRERLDTPLELKLCPKCQSVMLKRTAKTGPQQGKQFWACSTYPRCKGLVPLE